MEKLGPAARRGPVGPGRRRHPAVAQRAGFPRRAETPGQLHGQPAVAAAAGTWPRHRPAGHRRDGLGDEGACPPCSARRCSPTRRLSCSRWTRRSAASARRPTAPTSCSSGAAPSSWWCRRPSPTRCARRRSSSTGCPRKRMPLAGLILNRTHPDAVRRCRSSGPIDGAEALDADPDANPVAGLIAAGRAADSCRPGADRQAGGAAAVAVHRRQPARGDRRRAVAAVRCVRPGGAARHRRPDHRESPKPLERVYPTNRGYTGLEPKV